MKELRGSVFREADLVCLQDKAKQTLTDDPPPQTPRPPEFIIGTPSFSPPLQTPGTKTRFGGGGFIKGTLTLGFRV